MSPSSYRRPQQPRPCFRHATRGLWRRAGLLPSQTTAAILAACPAIKSIVVGARLVARSPTISSFDTNPGRASAGRCRRPTFRREPAPRTGRSVFPTTSARWPSGSRSRTGGPHHGVEVLYAGRVGRKIGSRLGYFVARPAAMTQLSPIMDSSCAS
jgi:hypothetical protein